MKCTYLNIRNCNRFDLSVLRDITITPFDPIQLVLGTNGAGKSSLFEYVFPCCPAAADFEKDGYYEHHCEHRNHTYKITSTIDKGFKHTFQVDDGENLNPGGTQPMQWKLIEEHFGLTEDLIRLLLGYESQYMFTEMRPAERRERLTQICPVNVDYALKAFQTVKQQMRAQKSVVEYLDNQLVTINGEHASVLAEPNTDAIEQELRERRNDLERLMGLPLYDSQFSSEDLLDSAQRYATFTRDVVRSMAGYNGGSLVEEKQLVIDLRQAVTKAQTQADSIVEEIISLDSILESAMQSVDGNPEEIAKRIEQLKKTAALNKPKRTEFALSIAGNTSALAQTCGAIAPQVEELLQGWSDPDNVLSVAGAKAHRAEAEAFERSVTNAKNALASFEEHALHLQQQPEQHCPKCNYRFHAGENAHTSIEGIQLRIAKGRQWLEEQQPKLTELRELSERYLIWEQERNELQSYYRSTPLLKPMWDDILTRAATEGYGYKAATYFIDWYVDINRMHDHACDNEEIERLETLLARLRAIDVQPLAKRRALLYDRRQALLASAEDLAKKLLSNERNVDVLQDILERRQEAQGFDERLSQDTLRYMQFLYTRCLRSVIADTVRSIAAIEKTLLDVNVIINKRDELVKAKDEAVLSYQISVAVAAELNPSNGIIADTIAGPINAFVEYMNDIIDTIWEYQLQILPCAIDAQGLNYRFPLLTDKSPKPRKDIINGSKGQKELINKAFIIALMHYKGWTDFPILLDEFASTFDPLHQSNAMSFVKRMIDTHRVSQVWFISHYVLNHSSFSKADCIVLDKNNIVLPPRYNENVTLK